MTNQLMNDTADAIKPRNTYREKQQRAAALIKPAALNEFQAACYINRSVAALRRDRAYRKNGLNPNAGPDFTKVDGKVLYRIVDLDRYLESGVFAPGRESSDILD